MHLEGILPQYHFSISSHCHTIQSHQTNKLKKNIFQILIFRPLMIGLYYDTDVISWMAIALQCLRVGNRVAQSFVLGGRRRPCDHESREPPHWLSLLIYTDPPRNRSMAWKDSAGNPPTPFTWAKTIYLQSYLQQCFFTYYSSATNC